MNPLTNVKNINKLNDTEAELGVAGSKTSWHEQYKDSAYIFVGGLPFDLTEGDIICVFSQYGEIVNINLVRDKKTGKSKGYCFVAYENQRSTILAVDNFNGIKLLGRVLRVDHVSSYRKPKEDENDDDVTKQLRQEGCAPRTPSPPQSENNDVEEDYSVPKKKTKREHKAKLHHKKKKKNKKDGKHSSKTRRDSSESESSQSETDNSPVQPVRIKVEKDRGYLDFETETREQSSNGGRQSEFSRQKNERGWPRDEGRMDKSRDRATVREQVSHGQWDRDNSRRSQHRSETEGLARADAAVDKWHRGEDRPPDRRGDRNDEADKTRDRGREQWEQKGFAREDSTRNNRGENIMKHDRSDERNEKATRRERDSHRERGSYAVKSERRSDRSDRDDEKYYERDRTRDRNRESYEKRNR